MQSVGPVVFLSSSLKSDNHMNGHVNRRNENNKKKRLSCVFVQNVLTSVLSQIKIIYNFIFAQSQFEARW